MRYAHVIKSNATGHKFSCLKYKSGGTEAESHIKTAYSIAACISATESSDVSCNNRKWLVTQEGGALWYFYHHPQIYICIIK